LCAVEAELGGEIALGNEGDVMNPNELAGLAAVLPQPSACDRRLAAMVVNCDPGRKVGKWIIRSAVAGWSQ
jgi:hypothetical protein